MMEAQKIIPELRFPEFINSWNKRKISNLLKRYANPVSVIKNKYYHEIGLRSHGKGIFYKKPTLGSSLGNKRVFWIKENAFILNIVFAWEQAIAITNKDQLGMIASHRFPMYLSKDNNLYLSFFLHYLLTPKGKNLLMLASPGGAGRNKTLGQEAFNKSEMYVPYVKEQQKIADFLSAVDDKLQALKKKKELLEQYKKGVMQKIFSQEIRFKPALSEVEGDENGKDFPDWEFESVENVLITIPTKKFQIKSKEYLKEGKYTVIDQGQNDYIGFSNDENKLFKKHPIIIFGDHTTIIKYVDIEFIVGADGVKILTSKLKNNLKYLYYNLLFHNVEQEGYKRHYSILKEKYLDIPIINEQNKIADFLSRIDDKINMVKMKIKQSEQWKKGLLQKMFV